MSENDWKKLNYKSMAGIANRFRYQMQIQVMFCLFNKNKFLLK